MKSKLSIFALLALLLASCTQEMIIPEEPVNEMEKAGETVTINATIPQDQEEDTRVAYNDGTRKLSWEENDQLLLVGFNGTTYKGHSTFTWTGTDNKFTGTTVPGATTYKAYYPANAITVDGNGNVHLAADFLQQTQTGNNSTAHLSGKLFLSDTDANALTVPFSLKAQNSIIKFVLSNIPSDIGTLKKLIWAVETKTGGNTRSVLLDINGVSSGATSLTAFVAFDPTEMKIAANGKVKITLIGNKSYEWSKTVSAGKNYNKGNRYTATVNSGWTAALAQFRFTITTDQANQYYTIYQNDEKNSPANLTIIWGDGTANTTIASGAILTKEIASHKYATAGNYTITIFSDKADPSYKQIPQITFYNYSFGDTKLTAILDPFPNMGAQNFDEDFLACSRLASVPAELFKYNAGAISFVRCFENCPQLSSIPSELFRYNTQATDFFGCFMRCSGLASIPAELFRYNTQARCFRRCFDHCTELASIPAELFRYCTQATDFSYCFNECNQLTAIPAELFKYNTQATDFSFCFCNCHGLTGANAIPTDLFRYNKQAENFECCFCSCDGLSEIPTELFKYNKQATDFSFCFYGCTGLTAIPAGLFVNNIVASNFQCSFTYCSGLTGANAIPADLFRYTRATNFDSCFKNCTGLTSLPADLFGYNTQATNFSYCFYGCNQLTDIPADLFKNNTQATSFKLCFYGCTGLTSLPADLFKYNTEVANFEKCFSSCTGLTTIPPALFFKNKKATNFSSCFSDCTKLELRADIFPRATGSFSQPDFFNDRTMDFTGFCKNVGTAATTPGTAPKLWEFNYASGVTTTECFAGANVTNSSEIPNDWK